MFGMESNIQQTSRNYRFIITTLIVYIRPQLAQVVYVSINVSTDLKTVDIRVWQNRTKFMHQTTCNAVRFFAGFTVALWCGRFFLVSVKRTDWKIDCRMKAHFSAVTDTFAKFDPDASKAAQALYACDLDANTAIQCKEEFFLKLEEVLDMAGFKPVPQDFIDAAAEQRSVKGLDIKPLPPGSLDMRLYYRFLDHTQVWIAYIPRTAFIGVLCVLEYEAVLGFWIIHRYFYTAYYISGGNWSKIQSNRHVGDWWPVNTYYAVQVTERSWRTFFMKVERRQLVYQQIIMVFQYQDTAVRTLSVLRVRFMFTGQPRDNEPWHNESFNT